MPGALRIMRSQAFLAAHSVSSVSAATRRPDRSLAGLTGLGVNIAVEDPRLEDFASRMENNTSALVLVADEPTTAEFRSAFGSIDEAVIQTNLNEHDIKALREHLKANRKRWE